MLIRRPQASGIAREVSERALRTVGEELRAARLQRGEELQDIAAYLRIRPAYLSALEEGNVAATPGRPYAIGFLRSYGDYVGLDGKLLAANLKPAVEAATPAPPLSHREPLSESRRPTFAVLVASLVLAGGFYAGYRVFTVDRGEPPLAVAEAPAAVELPPPAVATTPEPSPAASVVQAEAPRTPTPDAASALAAESPSGVAATPAVLVSVEGDALATKPPASQVGEGRVVLVARDSSWIQLRSADRAFVRSRTLQPGERFVVPERNDLALSTGNAGGLEILLDGRSLGLVGAPGAVVKNLPLAAERLQQRAAAAR
jgi:cytoskeleton protein RodZ